MKTKNMVRSLTFLVLVSSVLFVRGAFSAEGDEKAVRAASAGFYTALNKFFTGDMTLMREVWSHAVDVTYMGPGGEFLVGWTEVEKSWEKVAAMKLGGKVESVDVQVAVGQDLAVTSCYEKGENQNPKGEPYKVSIRATNIFRKEGGQWKMIGHHTDLLPYLAK